MLSLFIIEKKARIAQLVEQWIEDPRVTSSNLVLGILLWFILFCNVRKYHSFFIKV